MDARVSSPEGDPGYPSNDSRVSNGETDKSEGTKDDHHERRCRRMKEDPGLLFIHERDQERA